MDAYWRAANYLSVGQIYLLDNPLLKEPLAARAHQAAAARPLGHHAGPELPLRPPQPGHQARRPEHDLHHRPRARRAGAGGQRLPGGTYSEVYPNIGQDEEGMKRLFKQFSFPGGIPSHVAPETPGTIHEGGELGYALSHAYGAAFDNPDLIVACVVGDGEAETGPLATGWHGNKFLNPARDGCVLPDPASERLQDRQPVLSSPASATRSCEALARATATRRYFVEGDDPAAVHQLLAGVLDTVDRRDQADPGRRPHQRLHQAAGLADDRLPHAQGLDRPGGNRRQEVRGLLAQRTRCRWPTWTSPGTSSILEHWMKSYRPEELFDATGPAHGRTCRAGAEGRAPHERQPARQRRPAAARICKLPDFRDYAVEVPSPGASTPRRRG